MAENLTQQAIRMRDEAIRSFETSREPGVRPIRNPIAARIAVAQDNEARKTARDAQDAAFKQAELNLKVQTAADRAVRAEHDAKIHEIQTQVMKDRLANEMMVTQLREQKAALDAAKERQSLEHAVGYLGEVSKIEPGDPQWREKLTGIASKYPLAFAHKSVQETDTSMRAERAHWLKIDEAKQKVDADAAAAKAAGLAVKKIVSGGTTFETPTSKAPTPDQAGFISRYGTAADAVKSVQPILQKGGLNLNSKWDSAESDFQKAIDAGKITHDEARTAANAIDSFRGAVQTTMPNKPIALLQPHYDEIRGKLDALTQSAAPATQQSAFPPVGSQADTPQPPVHTSVATPAVPTEDPRLALAREALASPDATDVHRAAARKVLGLPEPSSASDSP